MLSDRAINLWSGVTQTWYSRKIYRKSKCGWPPPSAPAQRLRLYSATPWPINKSLTSSNIGKPMPNLLIHNHYSREYRIRDPRAIEEIRSHQGYSDLSWDQLSFLASRRLRHELSAQSQRMYQSDRWIVHILTSERYLNVTYPMACQKTLASSWYGKHVIQGPWLVICLNCF